MGDELILVQNLIHEIRSKRVMLDYDLAKLYQIETKALKQAVRRNLERFPEDFMFELTSEEHKSLIINMRSQPVTSNSSLNNHTRYAPFVFTEHLGSLNDLSEEVRKDIDNLYVAKGIHVYILTTKRNTALYSGVTVDR